MLRRGGAIEMGREGEKEVVVGGCHEVIGPFSVVVISFLFILSFLPAVVFTIRATRVRGDGLCTIVSFGNRRISHFLLAKGRGRQLVACCPTPKGCGVVRVSKRQVHSGSSGDPRRVTIEAK